MLVEPIDRLARNLHQSRPFLHAELEAEVRGARIAYSHEDAPEDHVDTGVEKEEETGLPRRLWSTEAEGLWQVRAPVVNV